MGWAAGLMVRVHTNRPTARPKTLRRCAQALDVWDTCMGYVNGIWMFCYIFRSCLRTSNVRKSPI